MNFFNKTKGAISIFLVIILVPMMTVSSLFVDAGKVKLAKGVAESAGDLALNTALTDYDTELKDMYGIFATAQDTSELFDKLEDYYRTCITSSGVSEEDAQGYVDQIMAQLGLVADGDDTADILNMELTDFNLAKRNDATLANATIIEKQIVDFMKYRAPINTGLSFLSSIQSFTTLSKQTELVDKRQEYYKEQESTMNHAQEAWKYINRYNKSGFIQSDTYFSDMKSHFDGYEVNYKDDIAKTIIKDLYDTQSYDEFSPYIYTIEDVKVTVDGQEKTIPAFYTNNAKTSKKPLYTELNTYSEENLATAGNVQNALIDCYNAYNAVKSSEEQLLEYNDGTYGLQFLVQTKRRNLYYNWVMNMAYYYDRYNMLRHTATYAGTTDSGASVMTTTAKICGSATEQALSSYYSDLTNKFDLVAVSFNQNLPKYNSKLQTYANGIGTRTSTGGVEGALALLYSEVTGYRTTISDAKSNLEQAVVHLGHVYDSVKAGGTLEKKAGEWENVADSSELKNTSMAKQDLAEIDSLSTYLNADDVNKLIERLNNIISNLDKMLTQIDSYTFFGTRITEISDYTTMCYLLKSNIGDYELKHVPTNETDLNNQINSWCDGKFVVGEALDVSWEKKQGTQAKLAGTGTDKLNFYTYLYSHFNKGTVSNDTTEKVEDKENGENFYNDIKSESESKAKTDAEGNDSGNVTNTNELKSLANRPSLNAGSDAETAAAEVKTGDSAAKDTSASLSSMFSSLASAVVDMGTDLRDKLYVSDYVLSMFSYDTIEKEYAVKNPGKELNLQSLTLTPINAENNFAYGKEVEYVIYGGSNTSNLAKAYGSIYGIRFGFNVIYAFMDSSIRDTAFAIATPISAATLGIIPVPLIQAAIIIGIACCESALDLVDLKNGESVPLFKNSQTWKCSIKGLINEVKSEVGSALKEVAKDTVSAAVDVGLEKLNELLDMTDEELTKAIEGGTSDITEAVSASYDSLITRHASTAIQKFTTLCNNAIEENMVKPGTDMAKMVSEGLDAWLTEEAANTDTANDLGYIVKEEAVKIIKQDCIGLMLEKLSQAASEAETSIADATNAITDTIDGVRKKIVQKIVKTSEKVIAYKDQMKKEIEESMEQGADSLKNTLNSKIDGIFGTTGGATGGATGGKSTDSTGISSMLSFTYSDYLRLFLMIGLYTNEEGILLRTADVIQANMSKKTGNADYKLSNSAVYVDISATVQVKPTMLALPLFANVEGNPTNNQNWYTFEYSSIKGY
ncbi:MAG: DUF5702 domain-containing protein [Acutalibacteraceae bacterium]|nr:DUF5702 domain-containing protein [Acutalibacteraceae bacterium]